MRTHTKLTYNPPLSLRFNGKELQIVEWGEIKRDKLDSNIFDNRNENTAYYRIYSKEYDIVDAQDIPKLFSSYSLTLGIIDTERYYKSNHLKEQDILESMKQDTSLPKGSYYLDIKDIEESLKIRTDYLYTRASGYKALNIYTIDTPNNQYKISYFNNPLDNIPYPKGTTFLTTPNTPIPTHYTDERVKIFLKGSNTYKNFILNLKQKIDNLKTQGYEMERVRLEVGYGTGEMVLEVVRKWEYSPNNADFQYWATISEFSLKLDGEIVKDSKNQEIKGYIIEPAGMNPEINKTAEEQQKTAGGDIRIPAGEYEVFWKKSDISKPALMIENPKNKEIYLNDLQDTIRNLDMNIEQLFCNVVVCKHNKNDRKTFGTKHIHIVPQLKPKNTNTTIIGKSRDGILIHYGDTGEWSTGCLLPTNELRWKKERWIAKDRDSTINAIARLYIAIIKHDSEAFKHYALGANNFTKSTIKKFIVKITEHDKIESYPPLKEK